MFSQGVAKLSISEKDFPRVLEKILRDGIILCDSCSGRIFGLRGYGLTNEERGKSLKTVLLMASYKSGSTEFDEQLVRLLAETGFKPAKILAEQLGVKFSEKKCWLCGGISGKYRELAERAAELAKDYEFNTFLIGCRVSYSITRREEELWRMYKLADAESLKNEASREIGKIFSEITGKEYSLEKPELTIIIDLENEAIEIEPAPLFICGRYRKLVRGLPQNPWPYTDDRVKYPTSIEELITKPMIREAEGESAKFHAAGREDIDAITLGSGRPFVVEIKYPRKRTLDLKKLEKAINKEAEGLIEVEGLRYCDRKSVKRLKTLAEIAKKKYRLRVVFEKPVDEEKLREVEEYFKNIVVSQRTPLRVLHRRADKVRKKVVYSVKAKKISENEVEFIVECQGGFYVKEFMHGDQGRTKPSIAEMLDNKVVKIELDVIDIEEV